MYSCIALNCIILSIDWFLMPANLDLGFTYANFVFNGIFILEAVIKIIAF